MRPDIDRYFMDMARLVASRSTCLRRSVGCVLVDKRKHVLATGYNGVPAGAVHCNDPKIIGIERLSRSEETHAVSFPHACAGAHAASGTNIDQCLAVHAEQNAILQCSNAYEIDAVYVTTFPCPSCTKLLLNTSCREIVYLEDYADDAGRDMWVMSGRVFIKFDSEPPMIQRDLVRLFGEKDPLNEWRVIVACVCLNLCSARVARGVIMRILERWPQPHMMTHADKSLETILKPLGFCDRRAFYLRSISGQWGKSKIEDLPGVGPYARDSVSVFCRGETPKQIGDRKVAAWVAWKKSTQSQK